MRNLIKAIVRKSSLPTRYLREFRRIRYETRFAMALSRAAATSDLRAIDPANPSTWEFSGFSQNGEDGIIDHLLQTLAQNNRYFIEIGAGNGLENNTSWLALARRYSGLMIEGDPQRSAQCREALHGMNWGVKCINMFVEEASVRDIYALSLHDQPDLFSIDIDGIDYYVAKSVFEVGFRPKVFVVEYNSAFGPEIAATVEYVQKFDRWKQDPLGLYYGVSIAGWRKFFSENGYRFVTVEENGVNAFFVDPKWFDSEFLDKISGLEFRQNFAQRRPSYNWVDQFELLKNKPLVAI